ncbi:MAG: L-serine ammonia-lyase, iron-sulfur-dependent, subunit beta [Epulopiscium sp.]|nr:L-serine ammonia-lyase, iron-sulfur-dependent, subunit beta [Candidatus Epulonipiscium sp.]
MGQYSVFDIVGPVMIGPSSSHTAGAARLGYMAKKIVGNGIQEVYFYLHGSFAKTYNGHGTDKALLAGVMGYLPDDERIRDAFSLAKKQGLLYHFMEADLGDVHPNTVKMKIIMDTGEEWEITGSSIGAGKIKIIKINTMEVDFAGEYTTLITYHIDRPGIIATLTAILAKYKINIAFMKLFREKKGSKAILILETDEHIEKEAVKEILQNKDIEIAKVIEPI